MRGIGRSLGVAAILLTGTFVSSQAAPAHKSAKECNAELSEHAAEIKKGGESPSAFFHACWTRSTPGQPTTIEAGASVEKNRTETKSVAHRTRAPAGPRRENRRGTARVDQSDDRPRRRDRDAVERREGPDDAIPPPGAPPFPQPAPLPSSIAETADTVGRALRAAGLPGIEIPIVVPGTLNVAPVIIAPR